MNVQFITVTVRVFFYCCLCAANIPIVPMFQPHILSRGIRAKFFPYCKGKSTFRQAKSPHVSPHGVRWGKTCDRCIMYGIWCIYFSVVILVLRMASNIHDPGIIFLFSSDQDIDACLAIMPPLPARLPVLTRGMKIYFNDLYNL